MTAVHPALARAFAALDEAAVAWALLRGGDDLEGPAGDVDLLVDRRSLGAAAVALRSAEYAPVATVGRGSHRFFLGLAAEDGRWLKLDLVTDLAFGPGFGWATPMAPGCLARRVRADGIATLGPDDAFWALLLHACLDKRQPGTARWTRLRELLPGAAAVTPWGPTLARLGGPGLDPAAILATVARGEPDALERLAAGMRAGLRGAGRARARAPWSDRLEPLVAAAGRPGLTVALIGQDGAGKSSVAAAVSEAWPFPSRVVYLGLWKRPAPPMRLVPGLDMTVRLWRAWRGYLRGRIHRALRRLVVFDRYPYDALLADPERLTPKARAYRLVVGHACPAPDLVILLDAPGAVAHARKGEHDPEHLERDRLRFLELARGIPSSVVVDAARPFDAVLTDVRAAIWRACLARWPA